MKNCKHCGKGAIHDDNAKKCVICGGTEFEHNEFATKQRQQRQIEEGFKIPKCPTCGSTNIRHISSTERGVNAVMFGFFGNKRKCQFECLNPNCRYRW